MAQRLLPGNRPPSTWQVFRSDMLALLTWVRGRFKAFSDWWARSWDGLMNWFFVLDYQGARRRKNFLIISFLGLWIGMALLFHPIHWGVYSIQYIILNTFFAYDIIRHMMLILLGFWLTYLLATVYLDDIFNLNEFSIAGRFIRQAAFASRYHVLTIRNGEISLRDRVRNPIIIIGGPGFVNIHLENAAMFEKIGGVPHVIGAAYSRGNVLDGFERFRQVIDLRDHVLDLTVEGRTQDGIRVVAKDVKLLFSVYRGSQRADLSAPFEQPYPFAPEAIENLVYKQGKGPWFQAMKGLIDNELRQFISQHTLSEFLANASTVSPDFVSRNQITDLFYDFAQGFSQRAEDRGVQLLWIGVGTWVTPSAIVPERHLEAWKLSSESRIRRSGNVLAIVRKEARLKEFLRLINELLMAAYNLENQEHLTSRKYLELAVDYREKLYSVWKVYQEQNTTPPDELICVLQHLNRVTRRWLGGESSHEP
jgi:hypothetical protein